MADYGYSWHVHHDILLERLTAPIEERRAYIREEKPTGEIELRLRLLRPVLARIASIPSVVTLERAGAADEQARIAVQCDPAVLALHAQECGCAWDGVDILHQLRGA